MLYQQNSSNQYEERQKEKKINNLVSICLKLQSQTFSIKYLIIKNFVNNSYSTRVSFLKKYYVVVIVNRDKFIGRTYIDYSN